MEQVISAWLLGRSASIHLGVLAFLLAGLYILQFYLAPPIFEMPRTVRRNRFILRAINWGIFAVIFLLRGLNLMGNTTGVARLAILFLMLPEIAYQVVLLGPLILKRGQWTQLTD